MNSLKAKDILKEIRVSTKSQVIFMYLADRSNDKHICWPGFKTIAKDCNLSRPSVIRAINELMDKGLIIRRHTFRANGSQSSNQYVVAEHQKQCDWMTKENKRINAIILQKRAMYAAKNALNKLCKTCSIETLKHQAQKFRGMVTAIIRKLDKLCSKEKLYRSNILLYDFSFLDKISLCLERGGIKMILP